MAPVPLAAALTAPTTTAWKAGPTRACASWQSRRVSAEQGKPELTQHLTATLGSEPFIDLVTFRRDGRAVHTPVWVSTDAQRLFVSTFGDSGKVKRAVNNPRVAVAACDGPGRLLPGASYVMGDAELLDRSEFRPGVRAHRRKYGTHFAIMWPARWLFLVAGHKRVWLLITLTPEVPAPPIPPPVPVSAP